jgi:hypothetical protein
MIEIIGSMVVAAILMAFPGLLTGAIIYGCPMWLIWLLVAVVFAEYVGLTLTIGYINEGGKI